MHVTAIVPSEELAMQVDNNGQFEDLVICIFNLKVGCFSNCTHKVLAELRRNITNHFSTDLSTHFNPF